MNTTDCQESKVKRSKDVVLCKSCEGLTLVKVLIFFLLLLYTSVCLPSDRLIGTALNKRVELGKRVIYGSNVCIRTLADHF